MILTSLLLSIQKPTKRPTPVRTPKPSAKPVVPTPGVRKVASYYVIYQLLRIIIWSVLISTYSFIIFLGLSISFSKNAL